MEESATLEQIAREILGIDTLEPRGSDENDIHSLAVWQIKAALARAYQAGKASAALAREGE